MSNETPNVPPGYENELRSKSKAELAQQASGWKTGTAPHWLCLWEIEPMARGQVLGCIRHIPNRLVDIAHTNLSGPPGAGRADQCGPHVPWATTPQARVKH